MSADRTRRIIRATGKVEPLERPLALAAFAKAMRYGAFFVTPLPALGAPPMVMVSDQDALAYLLSENREATALYRASHPGERAVVRGDVAILGEGEFAGFYPAEVAHA